MRDLLRENAPGRRHHLRPARKTQSVVPCGSPRRKRGGSITVQDSCTTPITAFSRTCQLQCPRVAAHVDFDRRWPFSLTGGRPAAAGHCSSRLGREIPRDLALAQISGRRVKRKELNCCDHRAPVGQANCGRISVRTSGVVAAASARASPEPERRSAKPITNEARGQCDGIRKSSITQLQLWSLATAVHGDTSTPARTGLQNRRKLRKLRRIGKYSQEQGNAGQAPPSCSWCTSSWSPSIMSSFARGGQLSVGYEEKPQTFSGVSSGWTRVPSKRNRQLLTDLPCFSQKACISLLMLVLRLILKKTSL